MKYIIYIMLMFSATSYAQTDSIRVIEYRTEPVYYLIYDNTDFLIYGKLEVGARLTTGRKFLEEFATEEDLKNRVDKLKWEGYYEANK